MSCFRELRIRFNKITRAGEFKQVGEESTTRKSADRILKNSTKSKKLL